MNRAALPFVAALSDVQVLALTLYGEARGESHEGREAVACVVRNRMSERNQTAKDVCLAPLQFSCWSPAGGTQNHATVRELAERLAADPTAVVPWALWDCKHIARDVLEGDSPDITHGANHYLTIALFQSSAAPKWARTMRETARIGRHVFLTDRPLP